MLRTYLSYAITTLFGLFLFSCSQKNENEIAKKVNKILSQMTLEEKVGQMAQITLDVVGKGDSKFSSVEPFMGRVGSPLVTQEMLDTYNNLQPEDIKPHISKEFAMKDVELPPLHQGDSPEDINERIQSNDKIANAQLDELNSFDPASLLSKAVKDK